MLFFIPNPTAAIVLSLGIGVENNLNFTSFAISLPSFGLNSNESPLISSVNISETLAKWCLV